MRIVTLLLAASIATLAAHALTPSDSPTKAIRFGSLVDGNGHVTKDAVVIVDADRITKIGRGDGAVPKDAEVIDLRPLTAIPGMIDLHTHMTYYWDPASGTLPLGQPRRDPTVTAELAFQNARKTLEAGVTTVRDLGASGGTDYMMRGGIGDGTKVGPRMFVAGAGHQRRTQRAEPRRDARRGGHTRQGRLRLDQGLRVERELPERGHHADHRPR